MNAIDFEDERLARKRCWIEPDPDEHSQRFRVHYVQLLPKRFTAMLVDCDIAPAHKGDELIGVVISGGYGFRVWAAVRGCGERAS